MNKQKFIELVENPASIREKDSDILAELARNYPYASLVHTLLAKAQRNSQNARNSLANAALYIPDRSVLKSIMEDELPPIAPDPSTEETAAPPTEISSSDTNLHTPGPAGSDKEENITITAIPEQEIELKANVFEELEENLRKLKEQRERFEEPDTAVSGILEEGKAVENNKESSTATGTERTYRLPERLQEIVENTPEKTIDDPKRVEQINLIDNFIRNSSSISRKYRLTEAPEEQPDLTGTNHFTPPDLVTENLAQIMVRQGKTEKAIDIYEKLVLKYPQKKAYFATCIEKLKNS